MRIINKADLYLISGAIASMQFGPNGVVFVTTGDSTNHSSMKINGISYNMIMHSDYVTDLSGNRISEGTSTSFCHLNNYFNVSPVAGGSKVSYAGSCPK